MSENPFVAPSEDDPDLYNDKDDEVLDEKDDDLDGLDLDAPAAAPGTKTAPAASRGLNRGAIRRIAAKAQEITETDERIVAIAATLLGTGTGLADLTTAVMAAPRSVTAPIGDLNMIATSEPMEAGINAGALGRTRLKAVWNLVSTLTGTSAALPAADGKAALAVAKAVFAIEGSAMAQIDAVSALLKKN